MGLVVVSGEAPVLSSDETVGTHVVSLWVIDPFFLRKEYEDFCGRHIKKGNKLRFPEKYCKKKNCTGLKFSHYEIVQNH